MAGPLSTDATLDRFKNTSRIAIGDIIQKVAESLRSDATRESVRMGCHQTKEETMNWYVAVLKKYAVFTGRARRSEYWFFVLFNLIITVILALIDAWLGTSFLEIIYSLAVLIPSLAVGVRRLHDTDRSGWWLLIGLVPLFGLIVLIVFFVQDSTAGANKYGPNPKGA
jgi:uncharacterized membrane protein YhaH (DUF805 family)